MIHRNKKSKNDYCEMNLVCEDGGSIWGWQFLKLRRCYQLKITRGYRVTSVCLMNTAESAKHRAL